METDRRALLAEALAQLTLDPLEPHDPRYVRLQEAGRAAVDGLGSTIDLAFAATTQLLSGPRGSGKTTELNRLAEHLRSRGFTVVITDMLDFVNPSVPIQIIDFLIAVALAVDEGLPAADATAQEPFATRFRGFLRRVRVSIAAGPVSATASAEQLAAAVPGLSVEIDLRSELKGPDFIQELRRTLAYHLGALHQEVAAFCQERVSQHLARHAGRRGVVMIVDSLEKLQGSGGDDDAVQQSVAALFVNHSPKLRYRSHHMVYTVPPYLAYTDPGLLPYDGQVRQVPIPQVRDRDREPVEPVIDELIQVIARRIRWTALVASPALLTRIVAASGGALRDLFYILRELITLTYAREAALPVDRELVDEAITNVELSFSQIRQEDADFLRRVDQGHGKIEPMEHEVARLARLVATLMLLTHMNGDLWYEVHPLARRNLRLP